MPPRLNGSWAQRARDGRSTPLAISCPLGGEIFLYHRVRKLLLNCHPQSWGLQQKKKTKYVNKKKSIFKKVKEKHKSQCPWRWLGRDLGQGKWPSPRPRPLPVYNLSPSPLQSLTAQWVCKLPEDSKSVWVLWTWDKNQIHSQCWKQTNKQTNKKHAMPCSFSWCPSWM